MYIIETCINCIYNLCCFGSKWKWEEPVKTATEIIYEMERMPKEEKANVFWQYVRIRREEVYLQNQQRDVQKVCLLII